MMLLNKPRSDQNEMRCARWVSCILIVWSITGCSDPVGDTETGWLRADIHGTIEQTFEGTGFFSERDRDDVPIGVTGRNFSLHARGTGLAEGGFVIFTRPGNQRPEAGQYDLAPLHYVDGELQGFTAFFDQPDPDGGLMRFATHLGEITIDESSSNRVRGTFRLVALLYCSMTANQLGGIDSDFECPGPYDPLDTNAPSIDVTGWFDATPFNVQLSPRLNVIGLH